MKAMRIHAPMQFGVEEVPDPAPGKGDLLLSVEACGLCGSDLRTLRSGHGKVTFPWTLGHEVCGTVEESGPGYDGPWKIGDRLSVGPLAYNPADPFCVEGRHELSEGVREIGQAWPGGLAEKLVIPAAAVELGNILATPAGLDPVFATAAEPASSVIHAQERARVSLGDTVLIMGAGPIGCLHAAVARARGAHRIIITDLVAERLALAESFEPDAVVDSSREELASAVSRLTSGRMPEVIITAAPAPAAQISSVELARRGGRVVFFGGLPHGNSTPGIDTNLIHYKNLDVIGISIFAPRHFRLALAMIESGRIPIDKLVTHTLPLARFNEGAQLALDGKALKVVFQP
ncbi:zinc-binding dehydrogenase [Salinispira pacifica]